MGYLLLVLALVFNACANVLIKIGSVQFAGIGDNFIRATIGNGAFMAGLALFGLNVVLYALALSRIPLSIGYPIMTVGGLTIITIASVFYLHESITFVQLIGLLFLALGIVLVTYK